jgi:hypothetical protein
MYQGKEGSQEKCRNFVVLSSENEPATEDVNCRHAVVFSYIDTLLNDAVSSILVTGVRGYMCTQNCKERRSKRVWPVSSTGLVLARDDGRKPRKRVRIGGAVAENQS